MFINSYNVSGLYFSFLKMYITTQPVKNATFTLNNYPLLSRDINVWLINAELASKVFMMFFYCCLLFSNKTFSKTYVRNTISVNEQYESKAGLTFCQV